MITLRAWQRGRLAPPWRAHFGMLLAGWGVFNVVEGILNHHVLAIHHVISGPYQMVADVAFLIFGAALIDWMNRTR